MNKLPVAQGLHFCRKFNVDARRREISQIGMFSALSAPRFPTDRFRVGFFALLCDGQGEGILKLEVSRLFATEPPQWIWRLTRWAKFPENPLLTVPVMVATEKLQFPAAGEYLVQLICDGQTIVERVLPVRFKRGRKS